MHTNTDHIVNPEMLALTRGLLRTGFNKQAFVPGDPSGGGGDPSGGGGGAPPMDPSMMGGGGGGMPMDPAMMGGGAPPPPPPSGGDPGLTAKLDQILQALQGGAGAGAGQTGATAAGGLKPKIDVNVEIMQIKHMLAKIIDSMGIPVSAQEMTATPEKLTAMAQAQQQTGQQDASMGGGGGQGAIPPMPPMDPAAGPPPGGAKQGSDRYSRGTAFDTSGLGSAASRAAAIMKFRQSRVAA